MPDEFTALPAAEGLPAAGPRRAAQLPDDHAGRELNEDRRRAAMTETDPNDSVARSAACDSVLSDRCRRTARPIDEAGADQEFLCTLNFGPQHPATHTTLRLILTLDGETIVKAVPDIGYLHSGFEKLGEDLDFNQYVTIVDRMNYISPLANEMRLAPRRREAARHRAHAAVQVHPHHHRRAGPHQRPPAVRRRRGARPRRRSRRSCTRSTQREKIYDIFEAASRPAVPPRLHPRRRADERRHRRRGRRRSATSSRRFPKVHADMARLLNRNRIFIDRTKGVGVLTKEDAINLQLHRPGRPGQRRRPRPPQGRAVPGLPGTAVGFKVVCAQGRRLLRPLPGPHGRDARERARSSTRRSRTSRPGR